MGIRTKIMSGFVILAFMLLIAGAWSVYEMKFLGSSVQKILDENYRSINAAKLMIEALEREDSGILLILSGNWKHGAVGLEESDRSFLEAFNTAKGNITEPGENTLIDEVEAAYLSFKDLWSKHILGSDPTLDFSTYFGKLRPALLETRGAVEKLMALNDRAMYRTASYIQNRSHRATMPGVVAVIAAFIFTVIFNYFINIYLVNPILRITQGIKRFLETKEPVIVELDTKDELRELLSSIEDMAASLSADKK